MKTITVEEYERSKQLELVLEAEEYRRDYNRNNWNKISRDQALIYIVTEKTRTDRHGWDPE